MTFIPEINTPSANLIRFNDNSTINELIVTGNCSVAKDIVIASATTSSLGKIDLSSVINWNCGIISCTNNTGFNIVDSTYSPIKVGGSTIDFFVGRPNATASQSRIGIGAGNNSNSTTDVLTVSGSGRFQGNVAIDTNLFYFNSSNGRIGIGTSSPSYDLQVEGGFSVQQPAGTAVFYIDNANEKISINTETIQSRLHLFSSTVANKIVDTDAIITTEKTGRGIMQIISSGSDSYCGIMFSAAALGSGIPSSNKHWMIFASWAAAPGSNAYGTPDTRNATANDLCFAYTSGSNNAPYGQCINSNIGGTVGTFGYIKFDAVIGDINFTGQHRSLPSENNLELYTDKVGLILVSDGTYCETIDPNDPSNTTISINEALPKVKLSQSRNDKRVFGVISDKEEEDLNTREMVVAGRFATLLPKKENDHRLIINSVGEGAIWVCNINGNLENGDYITSCEIPGHGMRQENDDLANYTVAKITCDCDFDLNSTIYKCEELVFNNTIYRRALVGCTYHCG
jgi:hypothetical protein